MYYSKKQSWVKVASTADTRLTASTADVRILKSLGMLRYLAFQLVGYSSTAIGTLNLLDSSKASLPVCSLLRGLVVSASYESFLRYDNVENTNNQCARYDPFRGRGLFGLTWGHNYYNASSWTGRALALPDPITKDAYVMQPANVEYFLTSPSYQTSVWLKYFGVCKGISNVKVNNASNVINRILGLHWTADEQRVKRFNHCVALKDKHTNGNYERRILTTQYAGALDVDTLYYLLLKNTV